MKRAVFPGSFDPVTLGHVDVVVRNLDLFDEIIVAVGVNADKKYLFTLEKRVAFLQKTFESFSKVKVMTYEGLTVDFCKKNDARFLIRGLRNTTDFEYEKSVAQANFKLAGIESVFVFSSPDISYISSSIVRDVIRNNGNYSAMVPDEAGV